jgi:hypothetical protein
VKPPIFTTAELERLEAIGGRIAWTFAFEPHQLGSVADLVVAAIQWLAETEGRERTIAMVRGALDGLEAGRAS